MDTKWKQAGEKLREMRKQTKLSIYKVARKTHITGTYLATLERGESAPSDRVLLNLAEFYNIQPAELFKLYDRVVPPTDEQLAKIPSLKKIMTQISIDTKLSQNEKEDFAIEIYEIVDKLYSKNKE